MTYDDPVRIPKVGIVQSVPDVAALSEGVERLESEVAASASERDEVQVEVESALEELPSVRWLLDSIKEVRGVVLAKRDEAQKEEVYSSMMIDRF